MALIMVLDDDRETCETIAVCLEKEGHEVLQVFNAKQAEERLAQRVPDLMLLDLMLPDEDGLEYLGRLVQTDRTKEVPIIVVSALRQKKKIVEGLKVGAVDYITKPFDLVELKVRVVSALKIHELKREQEQNRELEAMRETARTVQYEIELPMQEIQKCLIQLRSEAQDFDEKDQKMVEEAWTYYGQLEDILSQVQRTGSVKPKSGT